MPRFAAFVLTISLLNAEHAIAGAQPSTKTFIYSNACSSPGGDFEGFGVRQTRNPERAQATVEFSDDGSYARQNARNLKFNSTGGSLRFYFRGGDGDQYSFHGTTSL